MPPEDVKQPGKAAKTDFLDSLWRTLVVARKSLGDAHGKFTMRRLNRREYNNTIRDLRGVDIDVRELPADETGEQLSLGRFALLRGLHAVTEVGKELIA